MGDVLLVADLLAVAVQFFEIGVGGAMMLGILSKIWPDAPESPRRNLNLIEMSVAPTTDVEPDAQASADAQETYDATTAIQQAIEYTSTITHIETEYEAQYITVDRTFTTTSTVIDQAPTVTVDLTPALVEPTEPTPTRILSPQTGLLLTVITGWIFLVFIMSLILDLIREARLRRISGPGKDKYKDTAVQKETTVQKDATVQTDETRDSNQQKGDCHCDESREFWTEKRAYAEKRSLKDDESKAALDCLRDIFDKADHGLGREEMANELSGEIGRRALENHRLSLDLSCSSDAHTRAASLAKTVARIDHAAFVDSMSDVSQKLLQATDPWVDNVVLRDWLNRLGNTAKLVEESAPHIHATCPDDIRDPKVRPQRFTRSPDRARRSGPVKLPVEMLKEVPTSAKNSPKDLSVPEQPDSELQPDASKEYETRPVMMGRRARLREVLKKANLDEDWSFNNLPAIHQTIRKHGRDIEAAAKEVQVLYEGFSFKHQSTAADQDSQDDETSVIAVPAIKIDDLGISPEVAPVEESRDPLDGSAADVTLPQSPEPVHENDRSPASSLSDPFSAEQWSPSPMPRIRSLREPQDGSHQGISFGGSYEPDTAPESSTHEASLESAEDYSGSDARDTDRNPVDVDNEGRVEDSLPSPPEPTAEDAGSVRDHSGDDARNTERNIAGIYGDKGVGNSLPNPPESTTEDAHAVQDHGGSDAQHTQQNPVDVNNGESMESSLSTPPASTTEDTGEVDGEAADALALQPVADAAEMGAASVAGDEVEKVPAVSEDTTFAGSNFNATSTTEPAVETSTAATGHSRDLDADADRELEMPAGAPYQDPAERKDASSVEGTSSLPTEQYMTTDQTPTTTWAPEPDITDNNHMPVGPYAFPQQQPSFAPPSYEFQPMSIQPEPGFIGDKHTPSQAYSGPPQQQPSFTSPFFDEIQATQYQPEGDDITELADAWIGSIYPSEADFGFPEGPVAAESYTLPDDDGAMDGLEATGVALPASGPQAQPALFSASQQAPLQTETPYQQGPIPDGLNEDTDTYFEDVYMPNGQTIEAFQRSTEASGTRFRNASADNESETEMLDDISPPTPSDGRAPITGVQGWWNYGDNTQPTGLHMGTTTRPVDSDFDPFSATLPTDPDLFASNRPQYYGDAEQGSSPLDVVLSPLVDDSLSSRDGIPNDWAPSAWRYERDEYVISPTSERAPYDDYGVEDPHTAGVQSGVDFSFDASVSANSATPVPSVQPDYSTPPERSTSNTYANPTSSSLHGFSGANNGASAPYRPLAMSPTRVTPTPARALPPRTTSEAAIALELRRGEGSDESSDSSDEQAEVRYEHLGSEDEQVRIDDEQAKVDADAAALMARMDISHAANVAAAGGLSQAQQPQQAFSVFEMTSRLHAFVEPNRRRLESVKERAAAAVESKSDDIPKHWRERIDEIARNLGTFTDEAMTVNGGLMQEWVALDEDAIKGWSWEGTEGRRLGIESRIACVEMMLRLLDLLASEVGDDEWRRKVRWAIVGQVDVARSPSCAAWWRDIENMVGVRSTEVDNMQVELEQLVVQLAAEQAEMQSLADQLRDLEADAEMRELLGEDDDESDLSDVDDEVLARTEDDPLASEGPLKSAEGRQ